MCESGTPGGGAAVEADLAGAVADHSVAAAVGADFAVEAFAGFSVIGRLFAVVKLGHARH